MNSPSTKSENTTAEVKGRSLWSDSLRRLRKRKLAMVCFGIIVVYFCLAGFVFLDEMFKWDTPLTRWNESLESSYTPPSWASKSFWTGLFDKGQAVEGENKKFYLFGTDLFGQSTWRNTIYGA